MQARNSKASCGGYQNIHIWSRELAEGVKAEAGILNKDRAIDLREHSFVSCMRSVITIEIVHVSSPSTALSIRASEEITMQRFGLPGLHLLQYYFTMSSSRASCVLVSHHIPVSARLDFFEQGFRVTMV